MRPLTDGLALHLARLPGPDTSTKRDAVAAADPRYRAMLAEASRVGWPAAFENDLYQHDRTILAAHPAQPMLWILREHGTHLFPVYPTTRGEANYARTVIDYWSGEHRLNVIPERAERPRFYLVRGAAVREVAAAEALQWIRPPQREEHG